MQGATSQKKSRIALMKPEKAVEKCELLKQQKDNKDMKETYEVEIEKKYQELKDVHSSLDEVAGEKLALEAQLAASQSERQALLERCCANTSETENLHKTITDLRRRLEESQAALHELGRENQTLQNALSPALARLRHPSAITPSQNTTSRLNLCPPREKYTRFWSKALTGGGHLEKLGVEWRFLSIFSARWKMKDYTNSAAAAVHGAWTLYDLRNVGKHRPDYTAQQPRRQKSSEGKELERRELVITAHRITRRYPLPVPVPIALVVQWDPINEQQQKQLVHCPKLAQHPSLIMKRSDIAALVLWCRCTELRTRSEISSVLPVECMRFLIEPFVIQLKEEEVSRSYRRHVLYNPHAGVVNIGVSCRESGSETITKRKEVGTRNSANPQIACCVEGCGAADDVMRFPCSSRGEVQRYGGNIVFRAATTETPTPTLQSQQRENWRKSNFLAKHFALPLAPHSGSLCTQLRVMSRTLRDPASLRDIECVKETAGFIKAINIGACLFRCPEAHANHDRSVLRRRRKYVPPKRWYLPTSPHGINNP
ncbi:Early endosome antigen 1 [Zootermopsis nevadensis]|uniref:Early endosome antigen 1 n=1 Tax=Zootermopsis nevadensis TaxID=136037 RepID=A0A067QKT8_ZOONE|nr:Early endosome antigen 1 [Zootermopsis nevadensis]